jgi:hypothetical protein
MSLPVLRAIHQLVTDGASVVGSKPADDPSLADSQSEFHSLANDLFGDGTGVHHVGKGTVYAGETVAEALASMTVTPDFDYSKTGTEANLQFVHRRLSDGDIYFVDNRSAHAESVDATFRVHGKAPELWHPDTGKIEPVSFTTESDRTRVPLHFEPWGTVFVVFQKPAVAKSLTLPAIEETQLTSIEGPWQVTFQPDRGAPPSITLDHLVSWSTNADPGVKYFSGTGTYTKTIDAPPTWFVKGSHIWIDLGDVKNLAEAAVNGRPLGVVWHSPYRVDATLTLKPGSNTLTIKVTDAWVNRLIGDQQPGVTTKYTFTTVKPYKAESPLQEAGLLGPVTVVLTRTSGRN